MIGGHRRVAYRIMVTLRFRVRREREIRRNIKESINGFRRRGVHKKRTWFQLIVFKDFIFSYFFSWQKQYRMSPRILHLLKPMSPPRVCVWIKYGMKIVYSQVNSICYIFISTFFNEYSSLHGKKKRQLRKRLNGLDKWEIYLCNGPVSNGEW